MKMRVLCAGALCLALAGGAWGVDIMVDSFDVGGVATNFTSVANSGNMDETGLSGTDVLGGQRRSYLEQLTASGTTALEINIGASSNLVYTSGDSGDGLFRLSYGFSTDLNANLSQNGTNNSFRFLFDVADFAGTIQVIASTTAGGSSTGTVNIAGGLNAPDPDRWDYLFFSSMTGGADFSDIDRLDFQFETAQNSDWTIKEIIVGFTIPEPGLGLLLVPVLGGILYLRRRLSKKA